MTYHGLAEKILRESDTPLSANEIWQQIVNDGLEGELNSTGKTPWATLGARLYSIVRDQPNGKFATVGTRPKRFYLTDKNYNVDFEEFEQGLIDEDIVSEIKQDATRYLEKHLHPFLAHFAYYSLGCYTMTINHSKSSKKAFREWMHPDMVGCVFPIGQWSDEVLKLSKEIGNTSVKLISFELKKELTLHTLRENFFQTVSNSSWANESYLVAAKISTNDSFISELKRLSASFGIGVIELNTEDPNSSSIVFPARERENLDWDTINKLTMNKDFKTFLKRIKNDMNTGEVIKEKYDKILDEEGLIKMISK